MGNRQTCPECAAPLLNGMSCWEQLITGPPAGRCGQGESVGGQYQERTLDGEAGRSTSSTTGTVVVTVTRSRPRRFEM